MPPESTTAGLTPTRPVRIAGDLGEKLELVLEALDVAAAVYLDPIIRTQIDNDYKANAPAIKTLRANRERAKRLRDELPEMANDLGGENGGA